MKPARQAVLVTTCVHGTAHNADCLTSLCSSCLYLVKSPHRIHYMLYPLYLNTCFTLN